MSMYETTLRQIIYHYSQLELPINIADRNAEIIKVRGEEVRFAPIRMDDDISVDDRIDVCKDILVPQTLGFFNEEMRAEYYNIFCIENLMREIQFETVTYFLMRWKNNIKKCIKKYNGLYQMLNSDIDILSDYARQSIIKDVDDITHGKRTETTGEGNTEHSVTTQVNTSGEGEQKTVFEDTPESELLNSNYATNITKQGDKTSSESTTTTGGEESASSSGTTQESGTTERAYERILKDVGRNKSIPEIMQEYMDKQTNIIENMVTETSKGLFMLVY